MAIVLNSAAPLFGAGAKRLISAGMTPDEIGRDLYLRKRPLSFCNGSEERRGWILAQHEASEARRKSSNVKTTGARGGNASRGKPRKTYDRAPDWWLDEMKDALDEDAA